MHSFYHYTDYSCGNHDTQESNNTEELKVFLHRIRLLELLNPVNKYNIKPGWVRIVSQNFYRDLPNRVGFCFQHPLP